MKLSDINKSQEINCSDRGRGVVIKKTPKTLTIKFAFSTVKISYYDKDIETNFT